LLDQRSRLNWKFIIIVLDGSVLLINQHVFVTLERNWLENAKTLFIPLVVEDLEIFTGSLLDLNVSMVGVRLEDLLDTLLNILQTNGKLGECCKGP